MCVVAEPPSKTRLARSKARAQVKANSVIDIVQSISEKRTTEEAQCLKNFRNAGVQVSHTTPICLVHYWMLAHM
jgi:tRNA A-37 threonylcarbamoyl transferase component Bud32